MRWLLVKDLQILRRSPFLTALLAIYPVAIALMIGFALSSPPGKPKVAFYSEVPRGQGKISFGSQHIDIAQYASQLFRSIQPIKVHSRDEAIAKVRNGEALAALIIPFDLPQQVQSLVTTGVGSPTVELFLNSKDPLEREFVRQAIASRLSVVEQYVSKQVLHVAVTDLHQVLSGGTLQFLGQDFHLLGLRSSRTILNGAIAGLPRGSPVRAALQQVATFASIAIEGLGFASPVLGSIGNPLTVVQTQLAGRTTPADTYAAAIAVIISLMFVALLLAAGDARDGANRERLRAAHPGARVARPAPVREGRARGCLLGRGDARDGGLRVAVRAPRLEQIRAVGGRARARRAGIRRARGGDRRRRARGERGVADGVPRVAAGGVRRARAGRRRVRDAQIRARRDRVRIPVQGGPGGDQQRVQRRLAGDRLAARPPARAGDRVWRASPGWQ